MVATDRTRVLALAFSATLLLAGCASGSRTAERSERITLENIRFTPSSLTIAAGTTVRFTLVNADALEHEFVVGDEDVQREHAAAAGSGDHGAHDPSRASVPAKATVTFTYTFDDPGTLLYGCHIAGHYEQGMRGTITVTA